MAFGLVTEVDEGTEFSSRRELYDAGIHRALQAGIVGRQASGAESLNSCEKWKSRTHV